jgi:hypothetical protein
MQSEAIVSGDNDLPMLRQFNHESIAIFTTVLALATLGVQSGTTGET